MLGKAFALAALIALAVALGIVYGAGALVVLAFLLLWAGASVAFIVGWGDIARRSGEWYYRRQSGGR